MGPWLFLPLDTLPLLFYPKVHDANGTCYFSTFGSGTFWLTLEKPSFWFQHSFCLGFFFSHGCFVIGDRNFCMHAGLCPCGSITIKA